MVAKFSAGDVLVVFETGKAEHGMTGTVEEVLPYDGQECLDEFMYKADWRFKDSDVCVRACLPERWLKKV